MTSHFQVGKHFRAMPLYKRIPYQRQREARPVGRTLEGILVTLWERRRFWIPVLVAVVTTALVLTGVFFYSRYSEEKAARMLGSPPWPDAGEVLAEYPRSRAARLARLILGTQAIDKGDWDRAIEFFQPLTLQGDEEGLHRVSALHNLALIYARKGEFDTAQRMIKRATDDEGNPAPEYSQFLLGEIYRLAGQKEEAQRVYEDLAKNAVWGEVKGLAEGRQRWLVGSKK